MNFTPRITELYGASCGSFRVGEAHAYTHDVDELEREEKALEKRIQMLANHQAPVPIGVKFHREGLVIKTPGDQKGQNDVRLGPDIPFMRSSSSEEDVEEEEYIEESSTIVERSDEEMEDSPTNWQ